MRYLNILLFACSCTLVLAVDEANFLDRLECTTETAKAACASVANSICSETATTGVFGCACDQDAGFEKNRDGTNTCVKYSGLDIECQLTASSVCEVSDSQCMDSGALDNQYRCQCKTDFIRTTLGGQEICGMIILATDVPECGLCEQNDGTCFSSDGGANKAGCKCDVSRSGPNCETVNVDVTCDTDNFVMQICYLPHDGFNFTDPNGAAMYVDQKGGEQACKGSPIDPACPDGQVGLALSLNDTERETCGTSFQPSSLENVQYENLIRVVKNQTVIGSNTDITFRCYCSFVKYTYQKFAPIGFGSSSGGETGQINIPNLQLLILDALFVPVGNGVPMRVGDTMYLQAQLVEDDVYGSMVVQSCVASSKPNLYALNAFTTSLIDTGCPADGQTVLTPENNFQVINGSPSLLRTGSITVFAIPTGNSVYLHCRLKVCLTGDETGCPQPNCTEAPTPNRQKRSAAETVFISKQLFIQDPHKDGVIEMSSSSFIIGVTIGLVSLVVFGVFIIFMIQRTRKNRKTDRSLMTLKMADPVWTTQCPQRFAQPRVQRSTVRL
ncbi:hypothetical protein CAPTEDRAFT_226450 [Capitella teleta]|uniref:ZP domain-containing protein n=1 Tax=Capitella teleta TaxID=283909 RepID=R7UXV0_CAPTE|nr:hypothetical protein CAPTEDRAFT_226450 [Capitella teleta]|eukprot:ELU11102.1 hypothetical protein CAPTEDRAFT_226450 [Capitella teleta]